MQRLISIFENRDSLEKNLSLSEENLHYLKNVLRCEIGQKVKIYSNKYYGLYEIKKISKKILSCTLISQIHKLKQPPAFTVYQAILKREYMDFLIEKYGEIGVGKVVIIKTEYSQKNINEKTLKRYKKLLINGSLQAEHHFLPKIDFIENIENIEDNSQMKLCFYERFNKKHIIKKVANSVSILIGPEGGFSKKELDLLVEKKQFQLISPINSILKAETAGIIFAGLVKCLMDCNEYI